MKQLDDWRRICGSGCSILENHSRSLSFLQYFNWVIDSLGLDWTNWWPPWNYSFSFTIVIRILVYAGNNSMIPDHVRGCAIFASRYERDHDQGPHLQECFGQVTVLPAKWQNTVNVESINVWLNNHGNWTTNFNHLRPNHHRQTTLVNFQISTPNEMERNWLIHLPIFRLPLAIRNGNASFPNASLCKV